MNRLLLIVVLCGATSAFADGADKKIEKTWKLKCQSCHGADGAAQTDKGKKMQMLDMRSAAWQAKTSDADIKKQIREGMKSDTDGIKKEMDGYPDFSDEQLEGLVSHIRSFKK